MAEKVATDEQIAVWKRTLGPGVLAHSLIARIEQEQKLAGGYRIAQAWLKLKRQQDQTTIEHLDTCHVGTHCELWDEGQQATIKRLEKRLMAAEGALQYEELERREYGEARKRIEASAGKEGETS